MNVKENEKEKKNLSCWFFYPETKKKKKITSITETTGGYWVFGMHKYSVQMI